MRLHAQQLLDELRDLHHSDDVDIGCTNCSSPSPETAAFRCRDCFHSPLLCKSCIVTSHVLNPLHMVEEWTGQYFARRTLGSLGLVIPLGHSGQLCPRQAVATNHPMTVLHTTGSQQVHINFCRCDGTDWAIQLFRARLYPATFNRPSTAFSFGALKDFAAFHSVAKVPAHDYLEVTEQRSSDDLLDNRIVSGPRA